jgi:hypothetical protein
MGIFRELRWSKDRTIGPEAEDNVIQTGFYVLNKNTLCKMQK